MIFLNRLRQLLLRPSQSEPAHPFDRAYGVDTSRLYYRDRLPTGPPHDQHSEGYYATAPSLFHGALAHWQATLPAGLPLEDYTFVDLGSGKGRVVLMASVYPFREVRGIELSPALVRIAQRNLRRWTSADHAVCRDVRLEPGDVLGPELESILNVDQPTVLFLFNSFGTEVLQPLLEKLAAAAQHHIAPIDLIYIHPDHDRLVAATPGVELLCYTEIPFSFEDAQADLFGVSSDLCSIYRLGQPRPSAP
jgi:SAM-dependent methyltransferase